ncbi:flagellin [Parvularcula maris]|uniref:Flagellin n=1 Tax=Parvularcula maris TaxID=2965077 RepID=A0A9X2L9F5_9PROT|nr:flagellin [Parvularcula maris]MCQ8185509.1 flagellin [Parvularcula maris]
MKPISTFGQTTLRNTQLRRLEGELATSNNELSTGKKTDVARSLGPGLIRLQTIRDQMEVNESYIRSAELFKQRYDLMENSFSQVEAAAQDLIKVATVNGADALDSAFSINLVADGVLDRIANVLNVSIGSRYLFGGANVNERPVQPFDAPNANGVRPNEVIQAAIEGTGPAAPLNTGVDLSLPASNAEALELLARFESIFGGANFAAGAPLDDFSFEGNLFNGEIGGALSEIRLANNQYLRIENDQFVQGVRELFQGAFILSSLDFDQIPDQEAYRTIMTGQDGPPPVPGALSLITRGLSQIQESRTQMGLQYQLVDSAEEALRSQNALYNNQIVGMENVDRAEVTTRLLDIESQLQASYTVTGRVMQLRLFNFVR